VGSACVPWWDHIAFLMKTARQRRFTLHYPFDLAVDLAENGLTTTLRDVLRVYKRAGNIDVQRFIQEIKEGAKGDDLPRCPRRFLNWEEAREMISAGMTIGSHTHSHRVLTQLDSERQRYDLTEARSLLRQHLSIEADVLAYPVGAPSSISNQTQESARETGYRAAFSCYGGTNLAGATKPFDIKRVSVGCQSATRFRVRSGICRITGRFWP
jgi:hypothetical protein